MDEIIQKVKELLGEDMTIEEVMNKKLDLSDQEVRDKALYVVKDFYENKIKGGVKKGKRPQEHVCQPVWPREHG